MIRTISIENFKSIYKLEFELGRFNVLIGANGAGKSNVLEGIAFGGAAAANKLDYEFLASRGIRYAEPKWMRSGFEKSSSDAQIKIRFSLKLYDELIPLEFSLENDEKVYSKWQNKSNSLEPLHKVVVQLAEQIKALETKSNRNESGLNLLRTKSVNIISSPNSPISFLIYKPEESALRNFQSDTQILPLGIKGEGLFKLLKVFSQDQENKPLEELKEHLRLIDWFDDLQIGNGSFDAERYLRIKDQFLDDELAYFDQRSANEGFLYLLFYLALFISEDTPPFFAIDNVETALNPKLCAKLLTILNDLSEKHGKQVIFTTHNPAILDGLNLNDDEQRLFVIERNVSGHTKIRRVTHKPATDAKNPIKLSEAFMKGFIGGLPDNF